jgi:hypothetical protein
MERGNRKTRYQDSYVLPARVEHYLTAGVRSIAYVAMTYSHMLSIHTTFNRYNLLI